MDEFSPAFLMGFEFARWDYNSGMASAGQGTEQARQGDPPKRSSNQFRIHSGDKGRIRYADNRHLGTGWAAGCRASMISFGDRSLLRRARYTRQFRQYGAYSCCSPAVDGPSAT
jgi:hypothetical protein